MVPSFPLGILNENDSVFLSELKSTDADAELDEDTDVAEAVADVIEEPPLPPQVVCTVESEPRTILSTYKVLK